jgi:uncharacterized membrane protein (DUF4010 family)
VRTFFLIGVFGGIAGLIMDGAPGPASALLATAGAFIVASYVLAVQRPASDLDGTTESAALVVLALGVLAGLGQRTLASGAAVVVVLLLSEKARLHGVVHRVGTVELRAGLQFAVLALVILPLLPEGPFGPLGGIRPRALWMVVLLFSALSFVGYIAQRAAGPRRGYPIAGLVGGVVSSTAVTLEHARKSRESPEVARPLALGAVAAWTIVLPRVAIVSAILNPALAVALVPYLLPAVIVSVALGFLMFVRPWGAPAGDLPLGDAANPLKLRTAVEMAIGLQLVLMVLSLVHDRLGSDAVLTSAALLGLMNVDALTFAMARLGTTPASVALAAQAIAIGILATTAAKAVVGVTLGSPRFRPVVAIGFVALTAAMGAGFLLAR